MQGCAFRSYDLYARGDFYKIIVVVVVGFIIFASRTRRYISQLNISRMNPLPNQKKKDQKNPLKENLNGLRSKRGCCTTALRKIFSSVHHFCFCNFLPKKNLNLISGPLIPPPTDQGFLNLTESGQIFRISNFCFDNADHREHHFNQVW